MLGMDSQRHALVPSLFPRFRVHLNFPALSGTFLPELLPILKPGPLT